MKMIMTKIVVLLLFFASTITQAMPDASIDGVEAVKSWAWERVLEAQDSYPNERLGSPGFWGGEVVYQIQVDRFNDGDTSNDTLNLTPGLQPDDLSTGVLFNILEYRHGGDIQGITQRLDYLRDLGVTSLWITPVLKNTEYHGYCTNDFTQIDPGFGTNEVFREMVKQAHDRGMKVIMDIVINHMCDRGSFYSAQPANHTQCANNMAAAHWSGESTPWWDRGQLFFSDTFFPPFKQQEFFNRCGANSLEEMQGEDPVTIYGDFITEMFDFETRNRDFQDIFTNLHLFWIAYADVDGFRLDAAKHVTEDFLAYFSTRVREYAHSIGKENFYLVAEVAGSAEKIEPRLGNMMSNPWNPNDRGVVPQTLTDRMWSVQNTYLSHPTQQFAGPTAAYDFAHSGRARGALRNENWIKNIDDHWHSDYYATLTGQSDARENYTVLEIHDWPRFVEGAHKSNSWKSRLGLSYLASAQGSPVIYYGMEQGFNGDCHFDNIFVGNGDAANQVRAECSGHSHSLYRQNMFISGPWRLGSSVSSIDDHAYIGHVVRDTWADWKTDPYLDRSHEVYQTARRMNWTRHSCDALKFGWTIPRFADDANDGVYVFSRVDNWKEAIVVVNNSFSNRGIPPIFTNAGDNEWKLLNDGNQFGDVSAWRWDDGMVHFDPFTIPGNSVWVFVPANNHGPWRHHIGAHVCLDNPVDPQEPF